MLLSSEKWNSTETNIRITKKKHTHEHDLKNQNKCRKMSPHIDYNHTHKEHQNRTKWEETNTWHLWGFCTCKQFLYIYFWILCVLDRASSWYLNKGLPTRWHLLYYILLNMFQTLIRPSSGASEYLLCCVGWLEACWCYVAGLSVGDVVSECSGSAYTIHKINVVIIFFCLIHCTLPEEIKCLYLKGVRNYHGGVPIE